MGRRPARDRSRNQAPRETQSIFSGVILSERGPQPLFPGWGTRAKDLGFPQRASVFSVVKKLAARIEKMPLTNDQRAALAARVKYAREMGLGDFYRCEPSDIRHLDTLQPVNSRVE